MEVSVRPSVSDQPAGHFDRSMVKPSGPVSVLPSAERPHLLSVMRFTMASRCLAHSASQASIDVGWGTAAVVVLAPPGAVVVPPPRAASTPALTPASIVLPLALPEDPLLLSSPPQAVATMAKASIPAPRPRRRALRCILRITLPPALCSHRQ